MNLRLDRFAQRLETERLVLRRFDVADAGALFELVQLSRAHLDPWLLWPGRMTTLSVLEQWAARPNDGSDGNRMGLYTKERNALVGAAGLRIRSLDPNSSWFYVDASFWLAPHALGRGYATEAARRLTQHAFDDLGAPRVEIRTEPHNERSRRVAERLGFRLEGVLRAVGQRRGLPVDLTLYALTAAEKDALVSAQELSRARKAGLDGDEAVSELDLRSATR